jgi:hypothetical protein
MGRTFSSECRRRNVAELDAALAPGELGQTLRRECLCWSTVSRRRQRHDVAVRGLLSDVRRSPKADPN